MDSHTITISLNVVRSVSAASFTILYYDYALTLHHEIERFWRTGASITSGLYFVNRYLSLFATIPVFVEFYGTNTQTLCNRLQMYHQFLSGVTQVIVCALQIMRTYALCSRSRRILLSLLGLCGVECIISFWAVVMAWKSAEKAQTAQVGESIGCDLTMSRTQGQYMAAIWGCILIFDAVVFGLTFVRVLKAGRLWHGSLFVLLLRDGTIYFGLIFVCHLTNILTCLFAHRVYRGFSVTATNVIATSMMSRLMLKLRDPKLRDVAYHLPTAGNASPRGQGGRDQMSGTSGELESGTVTVYWASTHS